MLTYLYGLDHFHARGGFYEDGRGYERILVVDGRRSLAEYRRALNPRGRLIVAGGAAEKIMRAMLLGRATVLAYSITVRNLLSRLSRHHLAFISQLLEDGSIVPMIDRCYSLGELPRRCRYLAAMSAPWRAAGAAPESPQPAPPPARSAPPPAA